MLSIQSILLHLDASPRSVVRLRLAAALAARHGGAVSARFAASPSMLAGAPAFGEGGGMILEGLAEIDAAYRRQAHELFDAAQAGPRVNWDEPTDPNPLSGFVRQALTADLLILGQHDRSDSGGRIVPPDFVETVLIDSGKPAIVVPFAGDCQHIGRIALVAWKPTREAASALSAALPLLRAAEQVHVAAWGDDPQEPERFLLRHGIKPGFHREAAAGADAGIGELMLSLAADLDADLLVMGCYGHSRTREFVLGGASRTVLDSMTLPVLMAH